MHRLEGVGDEQEDEQKDRAQHEQAPSSGALPSPWHGYGNDGATAGAAAPDLRDDAPKAAQVLRAPETGVAATAHRERAASEDEGGSGSKEVKRGEAGPMMRQASAVATRYDNNYSRFDGIGDDDVSASWENASWPQPFYLSPSPRAPTMTTRLADLLNRGETATISEHDVSQLYQARFGRSFSDDLSKQQKQDGATLTLKDVMEAAGATTEEVDGTQHFFASGGGDLDAGADDDDPASGANWDMFT